MREEYYFYIQDKYQFCNLTGDNIMCRKMLGLGFMSSLGAPECLMKPSTYILLHVCKTGNTIRRFSPPKHNTIELKEKNAQGVPSSNFSRKARIF